MRILIGSPAFAPAVGGLERFVEQLASGLAAAGDDVVVMTSRPSSQADSFPFRVVRRPSALAKLRLVRESDVFFQANVSLRDLWPLLWLRRPWVVSHHGIYGGKGLTAVLGRLKVRIARHAAASIAVSRFVASRTDPDAVVIPNPYRDDFFHERYEVERDQDLLFVGRLVSDKGCDLLLSALARSGAEGGAPAVSIVGEGPEFEPLAGRVRELGLGDRVHFCGRLEGRELAREMNRHRVLVVPSTVEEGFGLVAIEGLACGCRVVVAGHGGLPEAIGGCGWEFEPGNADDLRQAIDSALRATSEPGFGERVREHLALHRGAVVIGHYRSILEHARGAAA